MKINIPFYDSLDTACFTCCHVLYKQRPILYVSHDEDGYWQFLCGDIHKEDEAKIVSLADILTIDYSMADFADLNYGEYAEKDHSERDWIIHRKS